MTTGECPVCRKQVSAHRERDGFGNEKPHAPLRVDTHAGRYWGRTCKGSREIARDPSNKEVK